MSKKTRNDSPVTAQSIDSAKLSFSRRGRKSRYDVLTDKILDLKAGDALLLPEGEQRGTLANFVRLRIKPVAKLRISIRMTDGGRLAIVASKPKG